MIDKEPVQFTLRKKRRGRPRTTGRGMLVGVRLRSEDLAAIDEWAAKQDDQPGRAETVRRLIRKGLGN
jgi:hypothetical protein